MTQKKKKKLFFIVFVDIITQGNQFFIISG